MTGTEVSYAALEGIERTLTRAAAGIEDCATSAPSNVDGGDLSALITSMISKVAESAGGLSEGLSAAGSSVTASHSAYVSSDDRSAWSLGSQIAR